MEYVLLVFGIIASAVGISLSLLHTRLMAKFNFTMLSRPFIFFFAVLVVVPTLVYLAYVTPCRNLDHFPVIWAGLATLVAMGIPLGRFNIDCSNLKYGLTATFLQLTGLAFAFMIGLFFSLLMVGLAGMDHAGMRMPCP
jgi:hypothetical protein